MCTLLNIYFEDFFFLSKFYNVDIVQQRFNCVSTISNGKIYVKKCVSLGPVYFSMDREKQVAQMKMDDTITCEFISSG